MLNERKGISTFIATLLLMVLAVSAGVVIYAYTMGYLGGFGGTEQLGAMSIDESTASSSANTITAYVRNIGKTSIEFDTVYDDGEQYTLDDAAEDGEFDTNDNDDTIDEGEVCLITINESTPGISAGKTYEVRIIATDNTQVSFSVKAS
jgi:hypothetical protein